MDLHFTDGSTLRDSGAMDYLGYPMHPAAAHGGAVPLGSWTQIKSNIGRWSSGKVVDRIWVAYDQPANTGAVRGYLDDILIADEDSLSQDR